MRAAEAERAGLAAALATAEIRAESAEATEAAGGEAAAWQCDVSVGQEVERMVGGCVERFGGIGELRPHRALC